MENNGKWHRAIPRQEEYQKARDELIRRGEIINGIELFIYDTKKMQ